MLSTAHAGVVKAGMWVYFVRQSAPSPMIHSDPVTLKTLGLINSDRKLATDAEVLQ